MGAPEEFRAALVEGDYRKLRAIWDCVNPHIPGPQTDGEAEIVMHRARTEARSVPLAKRAYSHRWLCERSIPSGLPVEMRPKAEQFEPKVALAVGIAVKARSDALKPAALLVRKAMETAVLDAHADGKLADSEFVKARMMDARARTVKELFGTIGVPKK